MKLTEDQFGVRGRTVYLLLLHFGTLGTTQDYAQAEPALQRVLDNY